MGSAGLRFLGTGTAFHTDGRGSQAVLVEPRAGDPFLVDAGPTVVCAMMRFDVEYARLGRLFVTHLHGDHTAGWPFLLLNLRLLHGRREPLEVFGPPGTRACLESLAETCYGSILAGSSLGFDLRYREIPVADAFGLDAGGMRFDVLPMAHHPTSVGYRFDVDGTRLAVTGDTGWCDNLERLVQGAHVSVVECTTVESETRAHVSLREIRDGHERLGRGRIVLVHLTDEVAAELAADPIPRVVAAHDGMTLPI